MVQLPYSNGGPPDELALHERRVGGPGRDRSPAPAGARPRADHGEGLVHLELECAGVGAAADGMEAAAREHARAVPQPRLGFSKSIKLSRRPDFQTIRSSESGMH